MDGQASKIILKSFAQIYGAKAALAERFYHHLFVQLPDVQTLFKGDFGRQKEMFAAMLACTVREAAKPDGLNSMGEVLRQSHARLNLSPKQLEAGGNALMAALLDVLGERLSDEEKHAWAGAITRLMRAMAPPGADQTAMQIYFISR